MLTNAQIESIADDALGTTQTPEDLANSHRVTPSDIIASTRMAKLSRCTYCEAWNRETDLDEDNLCPDCL